MKAFLYMPVVFPGFSWQNLKKSQGVYADLNSIPRLEGDFMWRQFYNAISENAETLYVAMFDEMDEGTCIFKVEENPPSSSLSQFANYEGLPSDYYLWLTGKAGEALRNEITLTEAQPIYPNLVLSNTYYVSATGAGAMDGSSESNAFGNFGTAMANIDSEGDKLIIIGAITPNGQNLTSKSFTFSIEGLDASSTIEGNGSTGRLFTINGATSADVTFKNLTFLNNTTTLAGGSVFFTNNAGASATFENCTFNGNSVTNNAGGGVIFSANGNLTITDCVFENNMSSDKGGAIIAANSGNINISGSLFDGNSATKGGAIAITGNGVDFVLSTSTFVNNTVSSNGGGALYLAGTNANSSITNTTIFNNSVTFTSLNQSTGGGIRIEGARPFTITNSLIYGNFVSDGSETSPSDIGGPPAVELTLINSLTQKIEPVLVQVGDPDGNDVFSTSITDADLSTSNLRFNEELGFVIYDIASSEDDTPIDFGSDGNDAGSWDSLYDLLSTDYLETDDQTFMIYYDKRGKNLKFDSSEKTLMEIHIYNIIGAKVFGKRKMETTDVVNLGSLTNGIYIIRAFINENIYTKKFIIY